MKYFFTLMMVICGLTIFAQIDSTGIQNVVHTGVDIVTMTGNEIIPNVPNSITGSIITMVVGLVIRFFEKRHLRIKGKLND